MSAHAKITRIAALASSILFLGWTLKSATVLQTPQILTGSQSASDYAKTWFHRDQSPEVPIAIPDTITTTLDAYAAQITGEKLGLNGRPTPPPLRYADEHPPAPKDDGSHMSNEEVLDHTKAIMDLNYAKYWRMDCPDQWALGARYDVLRKVGKESTGIKYFFALNLYQNIEVIPRLLSSIVQAIRFLGPDKCALSIVEGRSSDGTYLVLHELRNNLEKLGVRYWLNQSDINPHAEGKDRIQELSQLRNMVLDPQRYHNEIFDEAPLTFFINDVAICADDLLELLYQHMFQGATQTCAMDWVDDGNLFYDVWVSRSMSGNIFFEIPQDVSWAFSRNLFWDEPVTRDKYRRNQAFQVFSCWGGMTVIDSKPFISGDLEFRRSREGECYGGEPQTLASDLVKLNMSRVITVPYVSTAYSNHDGFLAKHAHLHVGYHVDMHKQILKFEDDTDTERIKWRKPPPRYRCMPGFGAEWWVDTVYDPNAYE